MKTKKEYEREIKELKHFKKCAEYEWNKERELFTPKMKEQWYEQKVHMVIDDVDIVKIGYIYRPLFNVTREEAVIIGEIAKQSLYEMGYICGSSYLWDKNLECYQVVIRYYGERKCA